MATFSVGVFVLTLTQLQTSTKARFAHLNDYQRAFNIACSALIEVLANIQTKQWSNRSFKNTPIAWTRMLYGGRYNLSVEDHTGQEYNFNVKIRVKYADRDFLFYWRLQYIPDLLDFARFSIPVYFGEFPAVSQTNEGFEGVDAAVNEQLARNAANRNKAIATAARINSTATLEEALRVIGIEAAGIMNGKQPRVPDPPLVVATSNTPAIPASQMVKEIEPGQEYAMKAMQFAKDGAVLSPESLPVLEALATYMVENPAIKILISGHTCNTGTADNFEISRQRAGMIASFLRGRGIDGSRLSTVGYGPTRPIADNSTQEGREKNRRAEFAIIN